MDWERFGIYVFSAFYGYACLTAPYKGRKWVNRLTVFIILLLLMWLPACDDTRTITETEYVDRDVIVTEPYYTRTVYDENMGEFTAEQQDELRTKGYITMRLFYKTAFPGEVWQSIDSGFTGSYAVMALTQIGTRIISGGQVDKIGISDDYGETWSASTISALSGASIYCLGTFGTRVAGGSLGRIIYSTDSGATWSLAATPRFSDSVNQIIGVGNRAWAVGSVTGTQVGVAYSDNGNTWTAVTHPSPGHDVYTICAVGSRLVVGLGSYGIFYSDDSGTSWTAATTDIGFGDNVLNIKLSQTGRLIAAVGSSTGGKIRYSDDNGETWSDVTSHGFGASYGPRVVTAIGYRIVAAGYDGRIEISDDDGLTWLAAVDSQFGSTLIRDLLSIGVVKIIACGLDNKMAFSRN